MRISRKYVAIGAALLIMGSAAWGDLLVLDTGERLSGRAVRITAGALLFHTTLEGQMMVPMDTVNALTTGQNFVVTLLDETTLYGQFSVEEQRQYLVPLKGGEARALSLAEVQEAVPIPRPPQGEEQTGGDAQWSASAAAGAQYRSGNRDHVDAVTRLELGRASPATEIDVDAVIERDDSGYFPGYFTGEAGLRGTGQTAPAAGVEVDRNTDAALDLRTGLNLGLAYDFAEAGLRTEAGLNVARESWDVSTLRRRLHQWRPFEDRRKTETELNLRLALRYSRALFGNGAFEGGLRLYPSLTDLGAVRARSEAAVLFPLTSRLKLRLDLLVDYDNEPQFDGLHNWSTSVGAGFHLDF